MLRVAHVQLHSNLLLAPIAGYCDLALSPICRELGGGLDNAPQGRIAYL